MALAQRQYPKSSGMRAVERGDMIGSSQVRFIDEIDVVIDLGRLLEDLPGRPALLFLTRPP